MRSGYPTDQPVLMNVALHGMEEAAGVRYIRTGSNAGTARPGSPVLVRYADDLLALCHSREQAEQIKARLAAWLAPRGLAFNEGKTRIVHLDDGVDFLGFNVRRYRGSSGSQPSARRPATRRSPSTQDPAQTADPWCSVSFTPLPQPPARRCRPWISASATPPHSPVGLARAGCLESRHGRFQGDGAAAMRRRYPTGSRSITYSSAMGLTPGWLMPVMSSIYRAGRRLTSSMRCGCARSLNGRCCGPALCRRRRSAGCGT